MSKCKSCGAKIIWLPTIGGKSMPCDPEPIPYREDSLGSMMIVTNDGRVVRAKIDASSETVGYVSHFATCPDAEEWRGRR